MCHQFGYSKQGYYKQLKGAEEIVLKEKAVVGLIKKKREIWKRGSGRNLQKQNIQISMTQTGDPLENAVAERIHKTIKEEFTNERQISFCNIEEAKTEIKKFIDFYNQKRPHISVEWLTPSQAHECSGELKRFWKSYKRKYQWGDLTEA